MTDEEKDVKRSPGFKLSAIYVATMKKVQEMLEEDKPVRDGEWVTPEVDLIKLKLDNLITTKPVVYLVNMSKSDFIAKKNKHLAKIHKWIQEHGGGLMVPFSIEFEEELYAMREDAAAQEAFLAASTQKSALPKMITQGYTELGMIYYFTAGEKEVRCWTLLAGSLAPQGGRGDSLGLRARLHQGRGPLKSHMNSDLIQNIFMLS
ncbi:hypothetical protein T484DRAFT_3355481 [Baffinella frigidus]|nr:hypothetical protein T484DRAFT_3355481 [Cryptophyta sp. CCMP2293]